MDGGGKNTTPTQEVRVALVMNGGVSLAVWMGGVTHELDRARRAGYSQPAGDEQDTTLPMWRSLLAALHRQLVIDVVAGTSAGGINGALLATSIARAEALPDVKRTWLELADYTRRLLIKTRTDTRQSMLDGDFFRDGLANVFGGIGGKPEVHNSSTATPRSRLEAALEREADLPRTVTLIVTGTNMSGVERVYQSGDGQTFSQLDYRARFTFKRDLLREHRDFEGPHALARLARAARCTASFPGAFEPTFVRSGAVSATVAGDAPGRSPEGPDMEPVSQLKASAWMIDGGVMDNEPFGPVLDAIATRPLVREVDRVVAYIVPSDDVEASIEVPDPRRPPPGLFAALLAADGLPREANILNGLQRMQDMLLRGDADRATRERLIESALHSGLDSAAPALFDLYVERRRNAAIAEGRRIAAEAGKATGGKLSPLPEARRSGEAPSPPPWLPTELLSRDDDGDPASDWRWGLAAASRLLRSALEIARAEAASGADCRDALRDISISLLLLGRIIDDFVKRIPGQIAPDEAFEMSDADVVIRLTAAYRAATTTATAPESTACPIGELVRTGVESLLATLPTGHTMRAESAPEWIRAFLYAEVIDRVAAPGAYEPMPRFRFHRFSLAVPSPFYGDGQDLLVPKLTGSSAHHFGAFFRKSWRAYDWMWGRLDGASHLTRLVVTEAALKRLAGGDGRPHFDDALATLRDRVDDVDGDRIEDALAIVTNPETSGAGCADALKTLHAALVKPLHRAILQDELPSLACYVWGDDCTKWPKPLQTLTTPSATVDDACLTASLLEITRVVRSESESPLKLKDAQRVAITSAASALRAASRDRRLPPAGQTILGKAAGIAFRASQKSFSGAVLRKAPAIIARTGALLAPVGAGFSLLGRGVRGVGRGIGRVTGSAKRGASSQPEAERQDPCQAMRLGHQGGPSTDGDASPGDA